MRSKFMIQDKYFEKQLTKIVKLSDEYDKFVEQFPLSKFTEKGKNTKQTYKIANALYEKYGVMDVVDELLNQDGVSIKVMGYRKCLDSKYRILEAKEFFTNRSKENSLDGLASQNVMYEFFGIGDPRGPQPYTPKISKADIDADNELLKNRFGEHYLDNN